MKWRFWTREFWDRKDPGGAEKEARLAQAEAELAALRARADNALGTLDDRHKRNHWREAIEQMITGAT